MDRYEQIRRTLFDHHQATAVWGMVVLKTKGMAAWTRSWRQYGEGGIKHVPAAPSVTTAPSHLPANCEEVVRVLAAMVWAIEKEAVQ